MGTIKFIGVLVSIAILVNIFSSPAPAQVAQPMMIEAYLPHTSCVVTVGKTRFCYATDGLWQSISGGAYTQVGASVTPTIINGKPCGTCTISAMDAAVVSIVVQ